MAEVKRKSKPIMKGMKLPVTIEDSINDVLVVCLTVGTRSFRGVLMDIQKRNEPHGIVSSDSSQNPQEGDAKILKPGNKIVTRKRSSGKLSKSPIKENSENEPKSSLSSLPLRHSYNQDLSLLDEQYAVFTRKPANFRFGSKVRNIRLRPRQVFCAKCKAACMEEKAKSNNNPSNVDKMMTRSSSGNSNTNANNSSTMTTRFSLRRQKMLNEEEKEGNNKAKKKEDDSPANKAVNDAASKSASTISTQTDVGDMGYVSLTSEIIGLTSNLRVNLGSNIPKVSPVIKISIGEQKVMEIPSRVHKGDDNTLPDSEERVCKTEEIENTVEDVNNIATNIKSEETKSEQLSGDGDDRESDAESYSSYKKRRKLMKKAAKDKDKPKASDVSDENGKRKHKRKRKHKHWNNEDKKMRYVKYNVKEFSLATDENVCDDTPQVKVEKEDNVDSASELMPHYAVSSADRPRLLYTWRPNNGLPTLKPKEDEDMISSHNNVSNTDVDKICGSLLREDIKPGSDVLKQEPRDGIAFHLFTPERSDNSKHNDISDSDLATKSPLKLDGIKVESKENLNPVNKLVDIVATNDLDDVKQSPLDSPLRSLEQFNKLSADVGCLLSSDVKSSVSNSILQDGSPVSIMSPITFSTPPHDDTADSKIDVIWNAHNESIRQASVIRSTEKTQSTSSNCVKVTDVWNASPSYTPLRRKNSSPDLFTLSSDLPRSLKGSSTPDAWNASLTVTPNNSPINYKLSERSQKSTPDQDFLLSLKSPNDSYESSLPFKQHSSPVKPMNETWKHVHTSGRMSPGHPVLDTSIFNKSCIDLSKTSSDLNISDNAPSVPSLLQSPDAFPFISQSSISSWNKPDSLPTAINVSPVATLDAAPKMCNSSIWKPALSQSMTSASNAKSTPLPEPSTKPLYPSPPYPRSMPTTLPNSRPSHPLNPQISPVNLDIHHSSSGIKSVPTLNTLCTVTVSTRTTTTVDARPILSLDRHPGNQKEAPVLNYIESRPMFNIFTPRNSNYKPTLPRTWSRLSEENSYPSVVNRPKQVSSQPWQTDHPSSKLSSYGLQQSDSWPQNSLGGISHSKLQEQLSPSFVPDLWKHHGVAKGINALPSPVEKSNAYEPRVVMNPEYSDVSDSDEGNDNFIQSPPPTSHKNTRNTEINPVKNIDGCGTSTAYVSQQHSNILSSKISPEAVSQKHVQNINATKQTLPSFAVHNLASLNAECFNSNYNNHAMSSLKPENLFPTNSQTCEKPLNHLNVSNHFNQSLEFTDKPSPSLLPIVRNHNVSKCVTTSGRKICVNDIVWGKVQGSSWWPARVLSLTVTQNEQGTTFSQVAQLSWFGSASLSYNKCDELSPFLDDYHIRYNKKKKGVYKMAVKQAALELQNDIKMYHNINLDELDNS